MIKYTALYIFFATHSLMCLNSSYDFNPSLKCLTQDNKKILFFNFHKDLAEKQTNNFLQIKEVRKTLGHMLRYDSVEDNFSENRLVTKSKFEFLKQAHSNNIKIPINPSDALLLKYWNKNIVKWYSLSRYGIGVFGSILTSYSKYSLMQQNTLAFLDRILKEENDILLKDKRVVYHATSKELYFLMKIQALILEHKNKQQYPDFLPLRNPDFGNYVPDFNQQTTIRQKFLQHGSDCDLEENDRYHLLSGNPSVLSNLNDRYDGNSTLHMLIQKTNINPPNIRFEYELKKLFYKNNMHHFYKKYKHTLKDLYMDACPYGIVLRLEFEPDLFEKTCYFSKRSGCLLLSISEQNKDNATTNYMNKVMQYPASVDNLDTIQLRVVLDHDLLLNPDNEETRKKFKVTAHTVNQQWVDNLNKKTEELFKNYPY